MPLNHDDPSRRRRFDAALEPDLQTLHARLQALRDAVAAEGAACFAEWRPLIRRRLILPSALNLAHYLALRRRDLHHLQESLMPWGLSSLGRCEARVLPAIDAVLRTLTALCGAPAEKTPPPLRAFFRGNRLLRRKAQLIFGPPPERRFVRIMVTLPEEAASNYELVHELLVRGMDCARINCAHGDPDGWTAMIGNVRRAAAAVGRACRIAMDLTGPRVRTGTVSPADGCVLFAGDRLLLRRGSTVEEATHPVQAEVRPPQIFELLNSGSVVCIDEGKLRGRVEAASERGAVVRIEQTPEKGWKLQSEKGLNFPGRTVRLGALTDQDLAHLDFVAQHADIIGYSFVQEPEDVVRLHDELDRRGADARRPAIALKIETARAIENLPDLIIRSAGRRPTTVMIARGDLAVEIGYERLAEMQEELLWLCEAAHVPVIWATQVLERLVKKGTPSRAEITDAAMSVRAECVMLNKGPFIARGVAILDDLLRRMQRHQNKKTPRLDALRAWGGEGG